MGLALAGCGRRQVVSSERRYPLTGEVVAVEAGRNTLRVHHDRIEGIGMAAMTMEFEVEPVYTASLKVGQQIKGDFVLSSDPNKRARLENISPNDPAVRDALERGAKDLRQATLILGKGAYREVGEEAPDFTLLDQEGRVVRAGAFRGKQVMLNFIYTRCPVATMCPASTARMKEAQMLAAAAGVTNVEFVSITFEPAYDTPAVLKAYAAMHAVDTSTNFRFLTGPQSAIDDLLVQFGVIAEKGTDLSRHTLVTVLIDETGRLRHKTDGSAWDPAGFVARMKK